MRIGTLGDIAFEVSSEKILTINSLNWSGSAKFATHSRHGGNALTEFTGLDPDKIEIEVLLSAYLGVSVQGEINKIFEYERTGKTLPFVLGSKRYGKYRWTITSHKIKAKTFDGKGNITQATVSISLQEYLKE